MERVWAVSDAALAHHPPFRQKPAYGPVLGNPVWGDDERSNLTYHVRHAALPPPGEERQLKRLAGPLRDAAIAFAAGDGLRAADRLGSV